MVCLAGTRIQSPHPGEGKKYDPRGPTATNPDCCRMQYSKISRYQIASFERYSISKMIDTRFQDCKGFEDYIPQAWKGFEDFKICCLEILALTAWWPTRGRRIKHLIMS
jgi:hypothetical protein